MVVIDQSTPELENVLSQLTMPADIIAFQAFHFIDEFIYKYAPFIAEIREVSENQTAPLRPEELNTVIVPAREEAFEKEFLGNHCWLAIRINTSMIDKLK